jgi:hypothetical protein
MDTFCRLMLRKSGKWFCPLCWTHYDAPGEYVCDGLPQFNGVGTRLHEIISDRWGQAISKTCQCGEWINKMNRWGHTGCRRRLREIVDHLMEEAKKVETWEVKILSRVPGARYVVTRMVLEAIRLVEDKENERELRIHAEYQRGALRSQEQQSVLRLQRVPDPARSPVSK